MVGDVGSRLGLVVDDLDRKVLGKLEKAMRSLKLVFASRAGGGGMLLGRALSVLGKAIDVGEDVLKKLEGLERLVR